MKAAYVSKTSVSTYKTIQCHSLEKHNLKNHILENLRTSQLTEYSVTAYVLESKPNKSFGASINIVYSCHESQARRYLQTKPVVYSLNLIDAENMVCRQY